MPAPGGPNDIHLPAVMVRTAEEKNQAVKKCGLLPRNAVSQVVAIHVSYEQSSLR
jgi:hypothetical protein